MADPKRIQVIVPIPMDAAGVANRRSQLADEIIAPGFTADFVAVPWGAALGDSYHDMLLMDWTVFQTGIDAEAKGYSAVVVDTGPEPAPVEACLRRAGVTSVPLLLLTHLQLGGREMGSNVW